MKKNLFMFSLILAGLFFTVDASAQSTNGRSNLNQLQIVNIDANPGHKMERRTKSIKPVSTQSNLRQTNDRLIRVSTTQVNTTTPPALLLLRDEVPTTVGGN